MKYILTQEQLEQLVRVYNTLLLIGTKGEDTILMATGLQLLKNNLETVSQQAIEEKE